MSVFVAKRLKVCSTPSFASGGINAASFLNRLQCLVPLQRARQVTVLSDPLLLSSAPSSAQHGPPLVGKTKRCLSDIQQVSDGCARAGTYKSGAQKQVKRLRFGMKGKKSDCSCRFRAACLSACRRGDSQVVWD